MAGNDQDREMEQSGLMFAFRTLVTLLLVCIACNTADLVSAVQEQTTAIDRLRMEMQTAYDIEVDPVLFEHDEPFVDVPEWEQLESGLAPREQF